jgi:hypothetical protein
MFPADVNLVRDPDSRQVVQQHQDDSQAWLDGLRQATHKMVYMGQDISKVAPPSLQDGF